MKPAQWPGWSRQWLVLAGAVIPLAALILTAWVAKVGAPLPWDVTFARDVQKLTPFDPLEDTVNWVGDRTRLVLLSLCLLVVVRAIVWLRTRTFDARLVELAAATVVAVPLNVGSAILKNIVESPRPTSAAGLTIEQRIPSYGFPSGHVYGDVLVLGLACVYAPLWLPGRLVPFGRAVLLVIILCAGAARIYVGAHWPSDTLGGYLWGATALGLALLVGHVARWVVEKRAYLAGREVVPGVPPRH